MRELTSEDLNPVFVMGCQRSGTTMLASQLAVPEDALALPELPFIISLLKCDEQQKSAAQAYKALTTHPKFHTLGITLSEQEVHDSWQSGRAPGVITLLINKYLNCHQLTFEATGNVTWIEHCPTNIDHFYLLRKYFPDARFIHIVRDPRAIYASMKHMARWAVSEPMKLSEIWLRSVSKGYLLATTYPEIVTQVRYEDYVKSPSTLQALCAFLNIRYQETMLDGGGVLLPEFTASQHKLTMRKTDSSRIDSWKTAIPAREAEVIVHQCYEWLVELGYICEGYAVRKPSSLEKTTWKLKSSVFDVKAKVLNKLVLKGIVRS